MGAQVKKIDNVFSEEEKEVSEENSVDDVIEPTITFLAKSPTLQERVARDARISAFVQK